MAQEFTFGVLDAVWSPVAFAGGRVEPLADRDALLGRAEEATGEGWLYPGTQRTFRTRDDWAWDREPNDADMEPVPGTERPAFLWQLPPTHRLMLVDEEPQDDRVIPGLVIHFVAWMHGGRVQFGDWRTDLRHPVLKRAVSPPFLVRDGEVAWLLECLWRAAQGVAAADRAAWQNLLILRTRIRAYEWPWERFTWTYTALDACWRILEDRGRVQADGGGHAARLRHLCDQLGIQEHAEFADADRTAIKDLRNNLIHEGMWDGRTPGHGDSRAAWNATLNLMDLLDRVILHVIDVPCDFRTSIWNRHGVRLPHPLVPHR